MLVGLAGFDEHAGGVCLSRFSSKRVASAFIRRPSPSSSPPSPVQDLGTELFGA